MRILGFSEKDWINYLTDRPKLEEDVFTTFRFTRKDKDWQVAEVAQIVYKPRRKGGGEKLGIAEIVGNEARRIDRYRGVSSITYPGFITETEALQDGFTNGKEMLAWLENTYGQDERWLSGEPMNKLTLRYVDKLVNT